VRPRTAAWRIASTARAAIVPTRKFDRGRACRIARRREVIDARVFIDARERDRSHARQRDRWSARGRGRARGHGNTEPAGSRTPGRGDRDVEGASSGAARVGSAFARAAEAISQRGLSA
jgi:hypothetical protein